eukprot:TRINITY_DN1472_c0_g2_i1.p1 TRINITY_DN1472_c0_g2~~TRINITY_DN1472_c0_g2_i1.p1  ORF type:complete len:514 (+),score=98.56 TRINITY_DN1472_c0_g2_i1:951-2492(+)
MTSEVQTADLLSDQHLKPVQGLVDGVEAISIEEYEVIDPEPQDGNVEYKLLLCNPPPERFVHLVTQMNWRLEEGQGEAIYEIGVEDDGIVRGITPEQMEQSLHTLERMAHELKCEVTVLLKRKVKEDKESAQVLVRRKVSEQEAFIDIKIAVAGNVDSGKSTLIGVLTRGDLDNGRGSARACVFRHRHEIETGRTSSLSHQIMGFDSKGECVNSKLALRSPSWAELVAHSAKLVSFVDLAGHERYLKTTVFGLCQQPDYTLLAVGANMGVTKMTREFMGISLALKVPLIILVTKVDIAPEHVRTTTIEHLTKLLKSNGARKIPVMIKSEDDVVTNAKAIINDRIAPIFQVSNVTGEGLDLLRMFLNLLPPRRDWIKRDVSHAHFLIDEDFNVTGVGTVVAGTMVSGTISTGDTLLLGPDSVGLFTPVQIKGIHTRRVPVKSVSAGQTASFALKKIKRSFIRKGMILIDTVARPRAVWEFTAEVVVLHHPTTIQINYQPVIHCFAIRQSVKVIF